MLDPNQRELLQSLWTHGQQSRWELHELTKLNPNRIGTIADGLIREGLLRERAPEPSQAGRPRVPLEIDPSTKHLIGLSIVPGGFSLCRLGLSGVLIEQIAAPAVADPAKLIQSAANVLAKSVNARTLSVGVTVTGFLDRATHTILLSSAVPGLDSVSLAPIYDAAGGRPVVLGNDMHAMAARWLLLHRAEQQQDVLLVWFDDGRLGSTMLIDGRPNRGCFTGGNELGHARFFVDTERCFCGQVGCLERIVSTDFLHRQDRPKATKTRLPDRIAHYGNAADASIETMLKYLCNGLANAVNFVRPHRLVLVSPLIRHVAFKSALAEGTRTLLMPKLVDAVRFDFADQAATEAAESAAWLAIAELLWTGWDASPEVAIKAATPKRRAARTG